MNIKKMFASLTGVLMLATMIPMVSLGNPSYGLELAGAYEYAYDKGITTMPSIDSANMYGELTRGQLAKMIANWAEKEQGKKVDETAACVFTDTNTAEGDLAIYVKKACQMGLMGQGIVAFRPNDKVTRGEFGTTLSRALWGDKYNTTSTPYYALHLQALKEAKIMNMIENPGQMEIRGYVMLMLQRAAETVTPSQCKDPAIILACALDTDACPAECKGKVETPTTGTVNTDVAAAGDLNVTVADYSNGVKSAPKGIFVANTLRFAASEAIKLESLTLKRVGLGSRTDIEKVWLERNGLAVTNAASVSSDGLAVLNFKYNTNTVTADKKTQDLDLVVQLKSTADVGNEFAFELTEAKASAKNISVKGVTNTFRVSGYTVVKLVANVLSMNPVSYKLGNQSDFVIGEFRLQSDSSKDDRDISVKSLSFRNAGTIDFGSTFKNVKVYRDSKVVSNNVEINGRDIVISLDKDVIKANRTAVYTIRAEVAQLENVGETVKLTLKNAKDIIADEADTSFRTNVEFDSAWSPAGELAEYKFEGGRVLLESESGFPKTINAGVGTNDVVIAKGRIVASEPIELPKIEIKYGTDWTTTDSKGKDAIKRLVLEIDGARYTADVDSAGNFTFDGVYVRKTSDVRLLISLDSNVTEDKHIQFTKGIGSTLMGTNKGEYQSNSAVLNPGDIAGLVQISKVLIKQAKFSIIADNTTTQSTLVNDATKISLMKGKLSSKDKDVSVNSFEIDLKANPALSAGELLDVQLDLNGSPFANMTLKPGELTKKFNSLGRIDAGKDMTFELFVIPTISNPTDLYLEVKAEGTDNNGNATATATEYSSKLEVKTKADYDITSTVTSDRVAEPTVNAVLYAGEINVKNGAMELTDFTLAETKGTALAISKYKLYVDNEFVAENDTAPNFTALAENLEVGKRKVEVKANVETTAGTDTNAYAYEVTDITVNSVASGKKAKTYFAKGFFLLSQKSTTNAATIVELYNNSPKTITVSKLLFKDFTTVSVAGLDGVKIDTSNGVLTNKVDVSNGAKVEISIQANQDKTAELIGIEYTVEDSGTYTYKLDDTLGKAVSANWILLSHKG